YELSLCLRSTTLSAAATAFLHFLCTPCGHPAIMLSGFSLPAVPPPENCRDPAVESPVPHPSLHPCQSGKIATAFFLNCTKNTELTSAHFTRTVTFALTKINRSCSGQRAGFEIEVNLLT